MTSKSPQHAYVWIWLPKAVEPVVAGKLTAQGDAIQFNYGKSYLANENAISLFDAELPLQSGLIANRAGLFSRLSEAYAASLFNLAMTL